MSTRSTTLAYKAECERRTAYGKYYASFALFHKAMQVIEGMMTASREAYCEVPAHLVESHKQLALLYDQNSYKCIVCGGPMKYDGLNNTILTCCRHMMHRRCFPACGTCPHESCGKPTRIVRLDLPTGNEIAAVVEPANLVKKAVVAPPSSRPPTAATAAAPPSSRPPTTSAAMNDLLAMLAPRHAPVRKNTASARLSPPTCHTTLSTQSTASSPVHQTEVTSNSTTTITTTTTTTSNRVTDVSDLITAEDEKLLDLMILESTNLSESSDTNEESQPGKTNEPHHDYRAGDKRDHDADSSDMVDDNDPQEPAAKKVKKTHKMVAEPLNLPAPTPSQSDSQM